MPDFSIGVDLGGTHLRIAAVSAEGQLLEKVTLGTKTALGPDHVITEMCDAIQRLTAQYQQSGKFLGAGLGIPGIIDLHTGMLRKSANLPGFEEYPVRDEVERRLGIQKNGIQKNGVQKNAARVVLENDANVAALGEQWLGAARGVSNMAVVTLGTGIGGGIIIEGKIWHGMNGMSGEFGHITLEPNGHPCGCGNRGCSEQYASASAILRMAREAIASGAAPSLAKAASSDPQFGAKSIYSLALQGDEHARQIFRAFGRYLGILLAALVNVLNLDMFVLGGGVCSAWDAYAPTMFTELRARSLVYAATAPDDPPAAQETMWGQPPLRQAQGRLSAVRSEQSSAAAPQTESCTARKTIITQALLGSDAGLYGAARVAVLPA
jgi:glucokinase